MSDGTVLSDTAADVVKEILAECRAATLPALREAVGELHPRLARISAYHLGWCEPDGRPTGVHAGKMLRAALAVLAARAFGASTRTAVPGAVATELVHNFSLLHDDLMDADELRRGRPTAWVVFGAGPAVLAGDALLSKALRMTAEMKGTPEQPAGRTLTEAVSTIIRGQAADLGLDGFPVDRVGVDDYLAACAKTSGLLGGCVAVGASLANAPAAGVRTLQAAAWDLGVAWQVADDVESIWGDPAASGKPAFGDLRRDKRTYPVIAALRSGTAAGSRLAGRLSSPGARGEDELAELARLVEEAGGRAEAERTAREHLDRAVHLLGKTGGDPVALDGLAALFRHVLDRHGKRTAAAAATPAMRGAAR
ncbi:polyprenyl synthetase family protein [Streptomyces sp. S07_1.15]|uniref:polyprenyl synthetase family protein n=1 Tax=Streptomyces sp. S07_1.15 TaxID=2873925 RepID=UPI001D15482A|nr:polyprenyl synthetase family protein [Streptomyces sp. S07_1.15]MCC3653121.1 polyprenyl synthetase family protein [Streptomyces sp. S07_1.15]